MLNRVRRATVMGVILVLGLVLNSFGETSTTTDVVLLKNGGVIKGKIIERIEGKQVTVETQDGERLQIPFKRIAEITTSDADYESRHTLILDSLRQTNSAPLAFTGTYYHARFAVNVSGDLTTYGVSGVVGIMTNKNFSIGPGIGWDQHKYGSLLPIYSEICYYIPSEGMTPFIYARGGFSIGWLKDLVGANFGGARWGFGLGLQRKVGTQHLLTAQAGYEKQSLTHATYRFGGYPEWISASIGLKF